MTKRENLVVLILGIALLAIFVLGSWKTNQYRNGLFEQAASLANDLSGKNAESFNVLRKIALSQKNPLTLPVLVKIIESPPGNVVELSGWKVDDRVFPYANLVFHFDSKGFLEKITQAHVANSIDQGISIQPPSTSYLLGSRTLSGWYTVVGAFAIGIVYLISLIFYLLGELKEGAESFLRHSQNLLLLLMFLTFCALFFYVSNEHISILDGVMQSGNLPQFGNLINGFAQLQVFPALLGDLMFLIFATALWVTYRTRAIASSGGS